MNTTHIANQRAKAERIAEDIFRTWKESGMSLQELREALVDFKLHDWRAFGQALGYGTVSIATAKLASTFLSQKLAPESDPFEGLPQ